jgi:hypothetical protein
VVISLALVFSSSVAMSWRPERRLAVRLIFVCVSSSLICVN